MIVSMRYNLNDMVYDHRPRSKVVTGTVWIVASNRRCVEGWL